ncbi:cytidine deaminase [Parabacteroides sp. OttesenSCG-928-G07]|nr:cytidine deaminase [Parabacteroides sp. OttesenSCG-928-G21]MDL2277928.1 cytidine deaminase [Parabacteroides sp. OttesenSCG-928-G07]
MKEYKSELKFQEVAVDELSPLEYELMNRAIAAAKNAYAPYSNFHVGVALMLSNGKIVTGNNQENAAYPSGLCAERVALFNASSQNPDASVRECAIVAMSSKGEIKKRISPCGACRQVMLEAEQRGKTPMRILMCGKEKVQVVASAKDMLPFSFSEEDLK